jgi:hypothetical protein
MTKLPPLLPEEILQRVLRLARTDGWSVLLIAGLLALVAASAGDYTGAITGLLIAGAGAVELHGESLIRHGYSRGMNWLVGSQIYLMLVVFVYCAVRLVHVAIPSIPDNLMPVLELNAQQWKMTVPEFLLTFYRLSIGLLAFLTFFYQGGMAIYYFRRRSVVAQALSEEPPLV